MPLAMLKRGDKARIMTIKGTDVVKKHLGALGFVPGVMVTVVQLSYGNMILGISGGPEKVREAIEYLSNGGDVIVEEVTDHVR